MYVFPMPSDSSFRTAISCSVSPCFPGELCVAPETTGAPCGNTEDTDDSVFEVANWSELIAAES